MSQIQTMTDREAWEKFVGIEPREFLSQYPGPISATCDWICDRGNWDNSHPPDWLAESMIRYLDNL